MHLSIINKDYPVWELTEFDLPELATDSLLDTSVANVLQNNSKREPNHLDWDNPTHFHFKERWFTHTNKIQKYLKSERAYEECTELLHMWPNRFERFEWGQGEKSIQIIHDRSGFKMTPHIDNRMVIGVVIINLQDNPKDSGTTFHKEPIVSSPWYNGPTKKGTGVFFLNNWNSWHSIENNGDDRLIAYDVMPLSNMFSGPFSG